MACWDYSTLPWFCYELHAEEIQHNLGQMHLKKRLCRSYKFLIASGRIDSRSVWRHIQDRGCLFPSDAVIFGTRTFHTQGAWVHIAQSCWEPKQDGASPFSKKQMPKKKQMIGAIQGADSDKGVISMNKRWTRLEVITQWDVRRRSWKEEFPILSRQCLTKCWPMTAVSGTQN